MTKSGGVWVLARHDGEGYSPPLQVFGDEMTARAAVKLIEAAYGTRAEIFEVPVWPSPAEPWPTPAKVGEKDPTA